MPELPEVETIVRDLRQNVIGKSIRKIDELRSDTVTIDPGLQTSKLGKITCIDRRGKYIIISTDQNYNLIIHLRMTGKLIFTKQSDPLAKHTRAVINFRDETRLLFDDTRTFGHINVVKGNDKERLFCKLGCEPFAADFNAEKLSALLAGKKTNIKNFLLNQQYIAGLGNIYVNEILYASGIPPKKMTNELTDKDIQLIVKNTKKILLLAIKHNGTSISDYRRVDNKTGSFQNFLQIYGKKVCRLGHPVTRLKTNSRSTFYCPVCQKERKEKKR